MIPLPAHDSAPGASFVFIVNSDRTQAFILLLQIGPGAHRLRGLTSDIAFAAYLFAVTDHSLAATAAGVRKQHSLLLSPNQVPHYTRIDVNICVIAVSMSMSMKCGSCINFLKLPRLCFSQLELSSYAAN